ncbi:MAG TPA: hypothetical protein VHE09_03120 [Rhizomicrobium sp.]|nr:hypothetical protein [Rhizomicrobium sp.]
MSSSRAILCLPLVAVLAGCGKSDSANQEYADAAVILAAKDHGAAVLTKSLRENLRVENGVVIVDGPIVSGAVTLSKNTAWSVSCGDGITVSIGKGEIDLIPPTLSIDDSRCAYLTKRLGVAVQDVIDGKAAQRRQ